MNSESGFLTPKPPFDFSKSLDFLGMFPPMRDDQKIAELSLARAIGVGGQTIGFSVRSTGLIKNPRLEYTLISGRALSRGLRDALIDRVGFFLSTLDDLDPFYRIGYGDVDFAPVVQKLYGLHQVKFLTPFECACWAVLSQRYPLAAAQWAKKTIVEKFGTRFPNRWQLLPGLPRACQTGPSE